MFRQLGLAGNRFVIVHIFCWIVLLTTLPVASRADLNPRYTNMPETVEWMDLTNHLQQCYDAVIARYEAAGMSTYGITSPAFIYPMDDYTRLAGYVETVCTNFVHTLDFDSDGVFQGQTNIPMWTASNLLSQIGVTDWSTNATLHSWAVTPHEIQQEVTDALNTLRWTVMLDMHPSSPGGNAHWQEKEFGGPLHGTSTCSSASSYALAGYASTEWQDATSTEKYIAWSMMMWEPNFSDGPWAGASWRCKFLPHGTVQTTNSLCSIDVYFLLDERNYFVRHGYTLVHDHAFVDIDGFGVDDGTLYHQQTLPAMLPPRYARGGTNEPTAWMGGDVSPLEVTTAPCIPEYGWTARGAASDVMHWVVKWEFEPVEPLFSPVRGPDPDTDRDDIADPGVDLQHIAEATGTIVWHPEEDRPAVYVPVAMTPAWYRGPPAHGYLSQGMTTNLCYQYLLPGLDDRDGWHQAYSFFTRIIESGSVTEPEPLKCVSVLRPRGNLVVFDFPWTGSEFSTMGFPTGINSARSYVLHDRTPGDDSDLAYDLQFDSGITHHYSGPIDAISDIRGQQTVIARVVPTPDGSLGFPGVLGAHQFTHINWIDDLSEPISVRYQPRPLSSTDAVTVTCTRDTNGWITAFAKNGHEAIEQSDASVADGTITYGWGNITRTSTADAGTERTVVLTRNIHACGTSTETFVFNAADRVTRHDLTFDGGPATATTLTSYADPADRSTLSNGAMLEAYPKEVIFPDGSWVRYSYHANTGWLQEETRPHDDVLSYTRTLTYSPHAGDTPAETNLLARPCTVTDRLGGNIIGTTFFAYHGPTTTVTQSACVPSASWGTAGNLTSTNTFMPAAGQPDCWLAGLPSKVTTPTETATCTYGLTTVGTNGWDWQDTAHSEQTCDLVCTTSYSTGEMQVDRWNAYGYQQKCFIYESGHLMASMDVVEAEDFGRPVLIEYLDGYSEYHTNYCMHGAQTVVGIDGAPELYTYHAAGHVISHSRPALGLTHTYVHDALLRDIQKTVSAASGESVTTTYEFDVRGRMVSRTGLLGVTTITHDDSPAFGSRRTTVMPSGATLVEDINADGSPREVGGTAVIARRRYESGADTDGLWSKRFFPDAGSDAQWNKTTTSLLGQTAAIERPTVGSRQFFYDTKGRWTGSEDEVGLRQMQTYGTDNRPDLAGLDVGNDDRLEPEGVDRFRNFDRVVNAGGVTRKTLIYQEDHNASTTLLSSQWVSHDGRQAATSYAGMTNASWQSIFGAGGIYTVTNTANDGTRTIRKFDKWRVSEVQQLDATGSLRMAEHYTYDGLGAMVGISNSVTGSTTIELDSVRRVRRVDRPTPLSALRYWYEPGTRRVIREIGADGTEVRFEYADNGLLTRRYDGSSYDLHYEYDDQGRLVRMFDARGVKREWEYDNATGRLQEKQVNDVILRQFDYRDNDQPKRVRLAGRVDMAGVLAHNAKGDVSSVSWTDGVTAPLFHTDIDRLGRIRGTLFNGIAVSTDYDLADRTTRRTATGGGVPEQEFSYLYAQHGGIGQIDSTVGLHTNRQVALSDAWNRLVVVSNAVLAANYTYPSDGDRRVNGVTITAGSTTNHLSIGRLPVTGKTTNMSWTVNGRTVASYISHLDTNAYRTSVFSVSNETYETCWDYAYNSVGELTRAIRREAPGGDEAIGMHFAYAYDSIGNTTNAGFTVDDEPAYQFAADYRDVHISRRWGDRVEIMGMAAEGTNIVITVNDVRCDRDGPWFRCVLPVDNPTAVETDITVRVVSNDVVAEASGLLYIPAAEEIPTYSVVNSLLQDSRFDYRFDGYGRLLGASNATTQLEFGYYADGQRAAKTVSLREGDEWVRTRRHDFVYDRWVLVYERITRDPDGEADITEREYIWGADLAGQQVATYGQDAGGIAGLLGIVEHKASGTNVYLTVHDQLGSIRHVIDATTGETIANYEYNPFGQLVGEWGTMPDICPFRFCTRYYDPETELYYYGYRYYDPRSTKWITTDPLEESGGINITTFCQNDPINTVDPLGLYLIAFDGTGNNKDAKGNSPTNIDRLWKSYTQGKYYVRGVGSSDTIGWRTMENPAGGLTGLGGKGRIEEAWKAVVDHYRGMSDEEMAADPLDIIGFSRGAALARDFANVVAERGDPRKYGRVYEWFGKRAILESRINIEGDALGIRFLGIYDTVPSFGKPGNHTDVGYTFAIPDNVANVRHATSRDENRDLFPLASIATSSSRIEQMFPGVHSDVGGGYPDNLDIQFGPLQWMWSEGVKSGVPWDLPNELTGWTAQAGDLQGHQSNVNPINWKLGVIPWGWTKHPSAVWAPASLTDKQMRPVWLP